MFDMGFTEMMLIGIVALIVIGPERLPGVARTAGKYFGRLKRFMTSVKADVEQELRADELREILAQQQKELDKLKTNISDAGRDFEQQASDAGADIDDGLDGSPDSDTPKMAPEPTVKSAPSASMNSPADSDPPSAAASSATTAGDSETDSVAEAPAAKAKS
jgi:sec-independent protein translocase protein TatB